MTKKSPKYEIRVGFECPLCSHLASRKADLKKHLMTQHGLGAEEALVKQGEAKQAYEEQASVRYYPTPVKKSTWNEPGGEV